MANARWIVALADAGRTVDEIVLRLGAPGKGAIADQRAFLNGARAIGGAKVATGDVVECWSERRARSERAPVAAEVGVLAREGAVLLAHKPALLPTEPERRGADALVTRLAKSLGVPSVHAASRLDVGVSGVVACATGPEGTRRLAEAKARGDLRRVYVAIVAGAHDGEGRWDSPIEGRAAATAWRAIASARGATWLEIELITGRTHQIRLHASRAGAPLFGDRAHGGPGRIAHASGKTEDVGRPLLHAIAAGLFEGSADGPVIGAVDPPPDDLRAAWLALDGSPSAWEGWRPPWERPR